MRLRAVLCKTPVLISLFLILYYTRQQLSFQAALTSLLIAFDSFPAAYTAALHEVHTHDESLIDFDCAAVFPAHLHPLHLFSNL